MAPDPFFKPWHGELTEELLPNDHVRRTVQTTPSVTEQVTYGPKHFEWKSSDGQVDITGTTTTPGVSYYLPTPLEVEASGEKIDDPRIYDMYYGQLYYFVDGTYYGNEVKGGVVIELMWGFTPYHDTWWVGNRIGHWANWITEYADGTQEYGGVFCASDGARGAVVASSTGEVVNTNEVNAVVTEKDAAESPLHIDYDFSGSGRWEWTGEPNGVLLPQSAPTGSLSLGTIHRVNEPREIVKESGVQLISGKGNCRTEHLTPAGLKVRTRRPSRRRPRRLKVQLVPSGAVLHNLRVTVRRRRRTIKTVTLDRLSEPQTLTIKTRRKLRRGKYKVEADAAELDAVSTRLRVRRKRLKARR